MMSEELETVALFQRLDPEHVEAYRAAHEAVPSAVTQAMERGGVHSFRLFVEEDISVGVIEVEDFEAFNETYLADEECQMWEEHVAAFKKSGVDVDTGDMPIMEEIWTFERD